VCHDWVVDLHKLLGLSYEEIGGKDINWLWSEFARKEKRPG
jgi:hypothetical protein